VPADPPPAVLPEQAYDAVLLLSFGGPEGPDDVMPFLENVTRGRGVPAERLAEVAAQYDRFGGVSPINDQNRDLIAQLQAELDRRGRGLTVHWGNRNWEPFVEAAVVSLAADGARRVLALTTSAYSSYSACRQYLDDIERARVAAGPDAPVVDKVRPYWNHPGFVLAMVERVHAALDQLPASRRQESRLVFTAHSIPLSMAATSDYQEQLLDAASLIEERLALDLPWDLVFQSRSGPPQVPWLEPDIVDHLHDLASAGTTTVVVVPIGFTSDHMEVLYDLDTQATDAARALGVTMVRAGTVGTHPLFVRGLADLLDEHLVGAPPKALGPLGARPTPCAAGCCPPPPARSGPTPRARP
jgi:ferrochelatase